MNSEISDFFSILHETILAIPEHRVTRDIYFAQHDLVIDELIDITKLAKVINGLAAGNEFHAGIALTRLLFEKSIYFYLAHEGDSVIHFETLPEGKTVSDLVKYTNVEFSMHEKCELGTKNCIRVLTNFDRTRVDSIPGRMYVDLNRQDVLGHSFPTGRRRLLWGHVPEDWISINQRHFYNNYLSWSHIQGELKRQKVFTDADLALLSTHYGYLSAFSHAPKSITDYLNRATQNRDFSQNIQERLILLYSVCCCLLALNSLMYWLKHLKIIDLEMIEKLENFAGNFPDFASELRFMKGPLHSYDLWEIQNVEIAGKDHKLEMNDIDVEYLPYDFLFRLQNLHTAQHEWSVNKVWLPPKV